MRLQRGPRPTSSFTAVCNAAVRDSRLSYRARGLLETLLSHEPGHDVTIDELAAASPSEGRDAVRAALRELQRLDYVALERRRDAESQRWVTTALVTDSPATKGIVVRLPSSGPGRVTSNWRAGAGKPAPKEREEEVTRRSTTALHPQDAQATVDNVAAFGIRPSIAAMLRASLRRPTPTQDMLFGDERRG